jgi:hypothetical protein
VLAKGERLTVLRSLWGLTDLLRIPLDSDLIPVIYPFLFEVIVAMGTTFCFWGSYFFSADGRSFP